MNPLTRAEIEELLGAYALDAVEPDEAAALDAALDHHPDLRAELNAYREVAGLLAGMVPAVAAPPFATIAATITEPPPPLQLTDQALRLPEGVAVLPERHEADAGRRARPRTARILAVAAAAVGILGLGALGGFLASRGGDPTLAEVAEAAARRPGSRIVALTSATDGAKVMELVVTKDGEAFLRKSSVAPLPPDRTYQMWAVVGEEVVSVGVMGNNPKDGEMRIPEGATVLALTDEVAGGVAVSQQDPVATATLS